MRTTQGHCPLSLAEPIALRVTNWTGLAVRGGGKKDGQIWTQTDTVVWDQLEYVPMSRFHHAHSETIQSSCFGWFLPLPPLPLSLLLLEGPLSFTCWVRNGWHSYSFEAVPGCSRQGVPLALLKLLQKLFQSPLGSTWGPLCCPGPCPWAPTLKGSSELRVITGDSSWHSPIHPF